MLVYICVYVSMYLCVCWYVFVCMLVYICVYVDITVIAVVLYFTFHNFVF